FGGVRILPRKVLIDELGNSFRDSAALAVLLGCRPDPFLHLDGIDLPRAFVHRQRYWSMHSSPRTHSSEASSGLTFTSGSTSGTCMTASARSARASGSASAVLN